MALCELIDYSVRPASTIELYEYLAVTRDDIAEVADVLPPDQVEQVTEGDFLVVYIVDNRVEKVRGLLSVWFNTTTAGIDTGSGTVWGEWDLDRELVVTAEAVEGRDADGGSLQGWIAYNSHGMRGIYTGEHFYTVREPVREVEPDGKQGRNEEDSMEPNFLCHDEEFHETHICQLRKKGATTEIKHFARDPKVSCLLCEGLANSADHVCSPVEFD